MKIISIIIPTYNMEKYLHKCLDSLIVSDGNLKRLEVIVVNDGSKDSSLEIAKGYMAKYPDTFVVIDKENGNYGSCVNRGLKEAKGNYIKVLDADDYFNTDVLDRYISFLAQQQVDMVISNFCIVDEAGRVMQKYEFDDISDCEFCLDDIPSSITVTLWHHAITYNRRVFDNLGYKQTEGISYTDDEWIFEPLVNVGKVICFPQVLYMYLRGREGQTFDAKVIQKTLMHKRIVANKMVDFYEINHDKCQLKNANYFKDKIISRLGDLYRCHFWYSKEDNMQISQFDHQLKKNSPELYISLDNYKNNYGWRYIRQWRRFNYSRYAPAIMFIRFRAAVMHRFGKVW